MPSYLGQDQRTHIQCDATTEQPSMEFASHSRIRFHTLSGIAENLARPLDLCLAGQEDKDVSTRLTRVDFYYHVNHGLGQDTEHTV